MTIIEINTTLSTLDEPLRALSYLIILDVLTGVIASAKTRQLQSSVGTNGLFRKVGIILCITLSTLVDNALQMTMFKEMTIAGFAMVEVMSVLENIDRAGYGHLLPTFIRNMFKDMYEKKVGITSAESKTQRDQHHL